MKIIILVSKKDNGFGKFIDRDISKVFIKLFNNRSLFQLSLEEAFRFSSPEEIFIIADEYFETEINAQIKGNYFLPEKNIVFYKLKDDLSEFNVIIENEDKSYREENFVIIDPSFFVQCNEEYVETIKKYRGKMVPNPVFFTIKGYFTGRAVVNGSNFKRFIRDYLNGNFSGNNLSVDSEHIISSNLKSLEAIYEFHNNPEASLKNVTEERPWGSYKVFEVGTNYKIKSITVLPGRRLSLQKHKFRNENWLIIRGTAEITLNNETFIKKEGDICFIPSGTVHRVKNIGRDLLIILEVQQGNYLGEDDIERFDDDYGRK